MNRIDKAFLALYCAVVGTVVSFILKGPELGALGYALSLLATIAGWFVGTAVVNRATGTTVLLHPGFRKRMWTWTLVTAISLFFLCLIYVQAVIVGRSSYPFGIKILHFTVLLCTATLTRIMTYSANRAVNSLNPQGYF